MCIDNMEAVYDSINRKSRPVAQTDVCSAGVYCKAIWATGVWNLSHAFEEIVSAIRSKLGDKCVVYTPSPTGIDDGFLHWTLFQTCTFPVIPDVDAHPRIHDEIDVLRRLTYSYPHLRIRFTGVSKTRHGLFLCGYPSWDINTLRAEARAKLTVRGCTIVEPHPQDIAHATLMRLTGDLTEEEMIWLNELVERYWREDIGEFMPTVWEYGFGTWRQRDEERIVVSRWPAHPRWILHRGLYNGPCGELENSEELLWKRLNEGWDIECDVWYGEDGVWRLGHDEPRDVIRDVEGLLRHPRAWIHCKNLAALQKCIGLGYTNCFFHDTDAAVLTSEQFIWAYPGHIIEGEKGVCVMPERHGFMLSELRLVGAVCTDYLPLKFAGLG